MMMEVMASLSLGRLSGRQSKMMPAFGVRTATVVRARHGQDAAALRGGSWNEAAAAAAILMHVRIAWPPRLGCRRRQKLAPAAAGEMPHNCVAASPELRSTEERAGRSPCARCSAAPPCLICGHASPSPPQSSSLSGASESGPKWG